MTEESFHPSGAESTAASEADLVALAQKGDEDAFRTLFEAHKRRVYSLCLRMTRSTADAEDLTQETFLKVFRKLSTFRGDSTFYTWLHRVAVNEVLQHLRKKRFEHVSLDEIDTSLEEPVKREYRDDDRRLTGTIDRINLNRAIADLPPGYRTAFLLHDAEGYEHSEIARMRNCSAGNSKSQLCKARRKLREWLRFNLERHSSGTRRKRARNRRRREETGREGPSKNSWAESPEVGILTL